MDVDIVIVGGGAAGMTAAIVAAQAGLEVLVVEKSPYFGGTTAFSGGALWIPASHKMDAAGISDSVEQADRYLRNVMGNFYEQKRIGAYLRNAREMLRYMEANSEVRLDPTPIPDYLPELDGAIAGRSHIAPDYDLRLLGDDAAMLRPPLRELMLFGDMQVGHADTRRLAEFHKSPGNFLYAARLFGKYLVDKLRTGRHCRLTHGNALAARLLRSARQSGALLWNSTPLVRLLRDGERVSGVVVERAGRELSIEARCGVVLATGGFGANQSMRERFIPMAAYGRSMQPAENRGDGIRLGQAAGGAFVTDNAANCIWLPISEMRESDGTIRRFPHFGADRHLPGSIVVDPGGRRFVNEGKSYQHFGQAMVDRDIRMAWLVGDSRFLRKYGMGLALAWPTRVRPFVKNGYLVEAPTIEDLAWRIEVDPKTLAQTVSAFNEHARNGQDPEFGRGQEIFSRFTGDQDNKPNPSLAPLETAPFYALKIRLGDFCSLCGLSTNDEGAVLDGTAKPIDGLYAVGIDANSVFRGAYPGGGASLGPAMTSGFVVARMIAARTAERWNFDPSVRPTPTAHHTEQVKC